MPRSWGKNTNNQENMPPPEASNSIAIGPLKSNFNKSIRNKISK